MTEDKPTFRHLRERYGLTTTALAQEARVAPDIVYFMLVERKVERVEAEQVLAALSRLTGVRYTLADVRVVLWE